MTLLAYYILINTKYTSLCNTTLCILCLSLHLRLDISVSNITRLKTALVEKDLVEKNGKQFYITDPVFALWFQRRIY